MRYVIRAVVNVYAVKVLADLDVISAYPAITIILTVFNVTVLALEVFLPFVILQGVVHAYQTSVENNVLYALQVTINILIAYHAIVILREQSENLVTQMVNVNVITISMVKPVINAVLVSIIIQPAKSAIVILLALLLNLLDVVLYQLVSSVNVKNEFKEEFVINADHYIGI